MTTDTSLEAPERDADSVDALSPRRTVWSLLSSLAIHSASVAAVLIAAVALKPSQPPTGLTDFETVTFAEDAPLEGGQTAEDTALAGETLVETDIRLDTPKINAEVADSEAVEEAVRGEQRELLEESVERIEESAAGVSAALARQADLDAIRAAQERAVASQLQRQVEALEKAAAARLSTAGVVLERPGADTDGSNLFTTLGEQNIVIIVDVSGSMNAQLTFSDGGTISALDYVKLELSGLIKHQLSPSTRFNIISFASVPDRWQSKLVRARKDERNSALRYVANLRPGGGTNLFDAVELAFTHADAQAIYILSDGAPTAGLTDPALILKGIEAHNLGRELPIHTLAFIVGGDARMLLKRIAEENYGVFRQFP